MTNDLTVSRAASDPLLASDTPILTDNETVMTRWTLGCHRLESTLQSLGSADLSRTVTIRGEAYSVVEVLLRAIDHIAYHTGQIVLLARHHCGASWQSLSVLRGGSDAYSEAVRRGEVSCGEVR